MPISERATNCVVALGKECGGLASRSRGVAESQSWGVAKLGIPRARESGGAGELGSQGGGGAGMSIWAVCAANGGAEDWVTLWCSLLEPHDLQRRFGRRATYLPQADEFEGYPGRPFRLAYKVSACSTVHHRGRRFHVKRAACESDGGAPVALVRASPSSDYPGGSSDLWRKVCAAVQDNPLASGVDHGADERHDPRNFLGGIDGIDESTPLAAELAENARRRIELEGTVFPRPGSTRILTVANQKGGVGKTTTTVNLAAALATGGLRVLVIDNDPQGNASTALGIDHQSGTPSVYDVLIDDVPLHEVVQPCPDVDRLYCAPATIDLSGAEIELVSMVARENRLRNAIAAFLETATGEDRFDYVFIDCPPSLGLLTVNAFVAAREVLIPIQTEYYALEGLSQLLRNIELIRGHLNPSLHVSTILLTMFDKRTNLARQVGEEVRTHFPDQTLAVPIPRSVRISEAPSYGQTVLTYDAGSSGALAYRAAAQEMAHRSPAGQQTTTEAQQNNGGQA